MSKKIKKYLLLVPLTISTFFLWIFYFCIIGAIAGLGLDLVGSGGITDRTTSLLTYLFSYGPYSLSIWFLLGLAFFIGHYGKKYFKELRNNLD